MRLNEGFNRAAMSLAIVLVYGTVAQSAVVYSVDDGTADTSTGIGAGTYTAANQFTAVAGGETIQDILIAWGIVANGTAFTARLWSDPNGDGHPGDAIQLSSLASTVSLANTSTFVTYDIPDVTLLVGEKFFVGYTITQQANETPAAIDQNPPISNQSWVAGGADFQGAAFIINYGTQFNGDWMIRANGVAAIAAVPEPASLAIWGLGALGLAVSAARRQRKQTRC